MTNQFCTECGTKFTPNHNFCVTCGTPVVEGTSAHDEVDSKTAGPPPTSPRRRRMLFLGLIGLAAALVVAVMAYQAITPPPVIVDEVPDIHDEQGLPFPDVPRISVAEAKERYDAERFLFVDVRDQEVYAAAHIPGAILFSSAEFETVVTELPRRAEIITYCT